MAAVENAKNPGDWKKRESFGSAVVQVIVAALVLGAGVYFYIQRGTKRHDVSERLKDARATALRDNPDDLQKALKELDTLFQTDGQAADGVALQADIETELWLTHRVPGADAKAREALATAESANSRSEERYANHVIQLVADGKAKEAEDYAEDLRKQGASSAKLWYGLALAYESEGNWALANTALQQATDKAWKNPRYFAAQSEAFLDQGNFDQALDAANKGVTANPEHIRSRLDAALARILKKDHVKDGADAIKDVLSNDAALTPGMKARALAAKAELMSFDEKYDDAAAAADQALAVNPNEHFALYAKARALAMKKDPKALPAFQAAVAAAKTAPTVYFDGAQLLQASGNSQGALGLLSSYEDVFKNVTMQTSDGKTIPVLDRDDRYWIVRGDVLKAAGKLDDAMASYDKAIVANSVNLAKAHYAKGALFLAKKDYDKAADELKLVTPEDGTGHLPEAYLAMGETLFAKKDFPNGCQNYAFALARMKNLQVPREKLNDILEDVNRRLIAAGQKPVAQLWMKEAKPIIQ